MRTPSVFGPEADPGETLATQAVHDEAFPASLVGPAQVHGIAVVTLGWKLLGVDDQDLLAGFGRLDLVPTVPVEATEAAFARLTDQRRRVEESHERFFEHRQHGSSPLVAGVETAIVEQGQRLDGSGLGAAVVHSVDDLVAQLAQTARRPFRQALHDMDVEILCPALLEGIDHGLADAGRDDLDQWGQFGLVAADLADVQTYRPTELVGAREFLLPLVAGHGEDEGAAVGAAATACIPVAVGHGRETRILARQPTQSGVDGLLLGANQTDLHVATIRQREHLRSQHGRVGDAEQLHATKVGVVARDDEEPRPVGRGVDVRGLDLAVDALLFLGQLIEVELRRRREGLDDVLERILVDAIPQVEELGRHLGIGQELLLDIALAQVFAHRMVVGEVAVVDQRLVHPDERVGAAGVPHAPFGGVALVGDPDVGFEILELVVLDVLLGIADQLEHQLIAAVRQHEGALLAQRGIHGVVQAVGIAPHAAADTRCQQKLGKIGGPALGSGNEIAVQPPQMNVFGANVVMGRHGEKRQARLRGRIVCSGERGKFSRDAVRPVRSEKFELFSARWRGPPISEVDDFALRLPLDRGVRFFDRKLFKLCESQ